MDDKNSTIDLPDDICEWVAPETLHSWVVEELKHVAGPVPAGTQSTLAAVLAFAYARWFFPSKEILGLCRTDPLYGSLCPRTDFPWQDIMEARHKERGLVVNLLVRLLTRAVAEKHGIAASSMDPALKRRFHESAVERLDIAITMDRAE
jgi:hypothetical protein